MRGRSMARRVAERERQRRMFVEGYRLATAEILYRMPDHPGLLQSYVWQDYDLPPRYPALAKFLAFWEANLDGKLHSVRLTSASNPLATSGLRAVAHSSALH
jgi:uncharacterized protein Usg